MAIESTKVISIETGGAKTSVKDLRNELKSLKDTLVSTEQGTKEYAEAMQRAANIQHQLRDTMKEINNSAMDFGQITSNVSKTLTGVSAGFQAAQAAMNLFGVESEDIIKSMQRMQSIMALTQALPALDEARKAMGRLSSAIATATKVTSGWGKALISTGIGAIVVALGYLIANFEDISKWLDELTGQTDFIGNITDKVIGGLKAGWAGLVQTLKAVGTAIVNYVTTPFKSVMAAIEAYSSTQGSFGDKLKAAANAIKGTVTNAWSETKDEFVKIGTEAAEAYQEGYEAAHNKREAERLKKEKEAAEKAARERAEAYAKAQKEAQERVNADIAKLDAERRKQELALLDEGIKDKDEYAKREKEIQDNYNRQLITTLENRLNKEKNLSKEAIANIEKQIIAAKKALQEFEQTTVVSPFAGLEQLDEGYKSRLRELYKQDFETYEDFAKAKADLDNEYLDLRIQELEDIIELEALSDEELQKALDTLDSYYQKRTERLSRQTEDNTPTEGELIALSLNQAASALDEFSNSSAWGDVLAKIGVIAENFNDLSANIKKGGKEAAGAYLQVFSVAFSAMGSMFQALADEQDTSNEKGFESAKKLQIASATMNMLSGIVSAWGSAMQLGPIAGPIMGAILSAMMTGLGIANIAKIKQQQFNSSSTATATPSNSAITSITAPVQYTQDVQGASIEGAIKDTRVYVLESDIASTTKKVNVAESEARF